MALAKQTTLRLFSDITCEAQSAFTPTVEDFGRRAKCQGRYQARCDAF
jgi:hypothetical protein